MKLEEKENPDMGQDKGGRQTGGRGPGSLMDRTVRVWEREEG